MNIFSPRNGCQAGGRRLGLAWLTLPLAWLTHRVTQHSQGSSLGRGLPALFRPCLLSPLDHWGRFESRCRVAILWRPGRQQGAETPAQTHLLLPQSPESQGRRVSRAQCRGQGRAESGHYCSLHCTRLSRTRDRHFVPAL